jgi:hypothetical protein
MRVHVLISAFVATFVLTEHASAQLSFSGIPYGGSSAGGSGGPGDELPTSQRPGDFVDVARPNQFGTHDIFGLPLTAFASQQDLNSTLTQLGNTQNNLAQLNANTQNSLAQLNKRLDSSATHKTRS